MSASRLIARLVEKKQHTFSVGGASFIGILTTPWIIALANITLGKWLEFHIPMIETMTAILIAYAFGEGIGRLACISFGCCYGKPLSMCNPLIQRIFRRWNFIFLGKTKKIAYDHQLDGQAVIPIQAITAIIYTGCGLLGFYLFIKGKAPAALLITLFVTQGWRFASEFLRADYRGHGRISAYQIMTLCASIYTFVILAFIKEHDYGLPQFIDGAEFSVESRDDYLFNHFMGGFLPLYGQEQRNLLLNTYPDYRKKRALNFDGAIRKLQ